MFLGGKHIITGIFTLHKEDAKVFCTRNRSPEIPSGNSASIQKESFRHDFLSFKDLLKIYYPSKTNLLLKDFIPTALNINAMLNMNHWK